MELSVHNSEHLQESELAELLRNNARLGSTIIRRLGENAVIRGIRYFINTVMNFFRDLRSDVLKIRSFFNDFESVREIEMALSSLEKSIESGINSVNGQNERLYSESYKNNRINESIKVAEVLRNEVQDIKPYITQLIVAIESSMLISLKSR